MGAHHGLGPCAIGIIDSGIVRPPDLDRRVVQGVELIDDGDRQGVWRDLSNIEPLEVSRGKTLSGIDFALVPTEQSPD